MIACHSKAGEAAAAARVYETRLEPLSKRLTVESVGTANALVVGQTLLDLAGQCREKGITEAGLKFARRAAIVAAKIETNDGTDLVYATGRVNIQLALAAALSQLGDNVLALEQAKSAETILEQCCRVAPEADELNRTLRLGLGSDRKD